MFYKILLVVLLAKLSNCDNVVETRDGLVRGETLVTEKNTTYDAYKGIPYASPPVGNLRFKAPIRPEKWDGILDATNDNTICYQLLPKYPISTESEDCLFLNVFSPRTNQSEPLPVMVWIFGGAYMGGMYSSVIYGPDFFMDSNVIIVAVNYRVGVFGFLSTEDSVVPGNFGLKDQLLAVQWVSENIAAFGGDPEKVTIFGESSGSASVSLFTLNKNTKGLYRAAIAQSSTALDNYAVFNKARSIANSVAAEIDGSLNASSLSSQQLLDVLQNVSAVELNKAASAVYNKQGGVGALIYGPVIEPEHEGAFLTTSPYGSFESGDYNQVPMIIGFNSEEGLAFVEENFQDILKNFDSDVTLLVPEDMNIIDPENKTIVGKLIHHLYTEGGSFADNMGAGVRIQSDSLFIRGIIKAAQLQSKHSDVYFYKFSYDGELGGVDLHIPGTENVAHAEEIRYMWNVSGVDTKDALDLRTRDRLVTLWTNFAKTLNPTPDISELNAQWPLVPSQGNDSFVYLDIGEDLVVKNFPREDTFRVWDFLYSYFAVPPLTTF